MITLLIMYSVLFGFLVRNIPRGQVVKGKLGTEMNTTLPTSKKTAWQLDTSGRFPNVCGIQTIEVPN